MVELLKPRRARLAIIIFPFAPQLTLRTYRQSRDYILKPQTKLAALCQKYAVPCLDRYPRFEQAYDTGARLYRDGIHLNPAGHHFTVIVRRGPASSAKAVGALADGLVPSLRDEGSTAHPLPAPASRCARNAIFARMTGHLGASCPPRCVRRARMITVRDGLRPRRRPRFVADARRAKNELGWQPQYGDLHRMIVTAWNWCANIQWALR
jgi:hypothetical protein